MFILTSITELQGAIERARELHPKVRMVEFDNSAWNVLPILMMTTGADGPVNDRQDLLEWSHRWIDAKSGLP